MATCIIDDSLVALRIDESVSPEVEEQLRASFRAMVRDLLPDRDLHFEAGAPTRYNDYEDQVAVEVAWNVWIASEAHGILMDAEGRA